MKARRVEIHALFNEIVELTPYVVAFSYTDNSDKTDDISLTLDDREDLWLGEWFPNSGDTLNITIKVFDWNFQGDNREINLGRFEIDQVVYDSAVTVNAVSVPITSSLRSEKKNKGWENVRLSSICKEMSNKASLELVYDTDIDPLYDRKDQSFQSDLEFIESLCKSDGLCLKVSDSKLIIFDESKYDTIDSALTIKKGESNIYGTPSFMRSAKNIYNACEITYYDSDTDKIYRGYFGEPNGVHTGHILRLQEEFNGMSDDTNLDRKAKARLREQNKNEWKLSLSLKGDIFYFAGMNIDVVGWKKFDGKYHVESVNHSNGSGGYVVDLECRKCLSGY